MPRNPNNLDDLSNLADIVSHGLRRRGSDDASAVVDGERSLTWAELDEQSAQLANVLRSNGVKHQDRVGIYLHKSIESLVAVHGVLRSGAAYVPLDPLAPIDLTASIIEDCEISVVVTASPAARSLTEVFSAVDFSQSRNSEVLIIGASRNQLGSPPDDAPIVELSSITWKEVREYPPIVPQQIDADGIAYIMYTSGSTGVPKGIVHTHQSGLAYANNAATSYELGVDDRMASLSPLHFDMSLLEFFAGVLVGATIVIVPEPYLKVPASLSEFLADQRCTTLYAVPSLFQQLLHRGGLTDRDFSNLRWVLPAGEVFPVEPLRNLFALWSHAKFSNIYGPAELNQCSYFTFDSADAIPVGTPLPIGKPWQDTKFKIVDEDGNQVPVGERGLLLVATSTMMSGYWKRPDLDTKAFVDLMDETGRRIRWYRTGDVVAARDDGQVVFLGRRDNQTKVRGHRVELETVEDVVCGLPAIAQVVVGPQLLESGGTRLAAFYQTLDDLPVSDLATQDEWRRLLARVLPAYAIPSVFSQVLTFPQTASGKIDRRTVRESIQQAVEE